MWAERAHATDGRIPAEEDPRWVCAFDADLAVLDLRDSATRRSLGVTMEQLGGAWSPDDPNRATLHVAAVARELGVDGMVIPSAARPGGWNLAVLPSGFERLRFVSRRRTVPPP